MYSLAHIQFDEVLICIADSTTNTLLVAQTQYDRLSILLKL